MRITSVFPKIGGWSFALALAVTSFAIQPGYFAGEAQAEGYHNTGTVLAGGRYKKRSVSNFGSVTHRSGVQLRYKNKHFRKGHRISAAEKHQRQVERRNIRVQRENDARRVIASSRRTSPNGRFLTRQERVSVLNGDRIRPEIITVTQGVGVRGGSHCPASHNCGYRIYSDGTGPRIITPGVRLGNDLPNYDGLNGPKVITLD